MKAYSEMAGVRQREQALALQGQEGGRAERRLGMAEQLLPGQLTADQLANQQRAQTIEAVARKVTGEQAAQAEFGQIHKDIESRTLTDPDDLEVRIGSALIKGGDSAKVERWLADREARLRGGKVAEHHNGIATEYMEAAARAAENPKDPMVWAQAVVKMSKTYPLGTPTAELYKAAIKRMDRGFESLPGPVSSALKEYADLRTAGAMSGSQAWSKVLQTVDPAFQAEFNKLMPPEVKAEYGALAKGGEEKAGAEGRLPSELKKIEAQGAQQRALEAEKEKGRATRAARPAKEQKILLENETKRLGQIEERLKMPFLDEVERAGLQADRTASIAKRDEYQEYLVLARDREGIKEPEPGALDPKKVRAEAIGPFTTQLRQKSKSLEYSKATLDLSLRNGKISQAEHAQLLAAETKRWGKK